MLRRLRSLCALLLVVIGLSGSLAGCAVAPAVREMMGPPMSCKDAENFVEEGKASWYGSFHQGRPTASGERFDTRKMTAAHRRLPLGSQIKVHNLENGREATFKVNDRGPYIVDRIVDLSQTGARTLGFERDGIVPVKLEVIACGQWVKGDDKPTAEAPGDQAPPPEPEPKSPIPWDKVPIVPPPGPAVPSPAAPATPSPPPSG